MGKNKRRLARLLPATRCKAHSKRTGEPCNNPPMNGQETCRMHGGATKAARAKAEERIAAAADPAAAKLVELMSSRKVPYSVQLVAAKDLLDRAGVGKEQAVTLTLKKWEQDIEGLVVDLPAPAYDDDIVDGEVVDSDPLPSSRPHDGSYPGPQPPQYGTGYATDGFGR